MDPAVAAARASLKRDHREACKADTASTSREQPCSAEPAATPTPANMASPASRHDAPHDYEHRSVLARLFNDAAPSSPSLHSAVSRLTVETAASHQSIESPPRKELLAPDGAPLSWPRAYARQSNQLSTLLRSHTTTNHVIPIAPRSASNDFRQQLQMQQQQRFFVTATEHRHKQYPEAEAEPLDEVSMLKEQVALLLKNLEDEKKRRHLEQKLMQEKIIELQGLIRRNYPEQQKAQERRLVAMRSPSASRSKLLRTSSKHAAKVPQLSLSRKSSKSSDMGASSSNSCSGASEECDENNHPSPHENNINDQEGDPEDQKKRRASSAGSSSSPGGGGVKTMKEDAKAVEARMKRQLTKLRARMQAMVTDAQLETQSLRMQLQSEKQSHDRKERQLRMEMNAKVFATEERHATAKKRLTTKVALLSSHVNQLLTENEILADQLKEKDARIAHLELAVGGKLVVENLYPS